MTESTKNQVELFEDAFQSVCKYLEKLDDKRPQIEDVKKETDILVNSLLDAGRECERFFLQKHLQISNARPEQILREECNELRQEINKKDAAIKKHHEKLKLWQQSLKTGQQPVRVQSQAAARMGQGIPAAYAVQGQPLAPSNSNTNT